MTDWKYDYGVVNRDYSAMLLWTLIKLNPDAKIDANLRDHCSDCLLVAITDVVRFLDINDKNFTPGSEQGTLHRTGE